MAAPPLKTPRTCSQCGNNGHNARTCTETTTTTTTTTPGDGGGGFMLFGVRVTTTSSDGLPCGSGFRKSMSMNNLSQYEQQRNGNGNDSPGYGHGDHGYGDGGYVSDDAVHASSSPGRNRERKRGVAWTEEEHKLFLLGLKKVGKGDWRGISRNYVKTRTPTQVASHAQKYFLRHTNFNRRRRRSSLFDITTDTVTNSSIEDQPFIEDVPSQSKTSLSPSPTATNQSANVNMNITSTFPNPFTPTISPTCSKQSPPIPPSAKMAKLNLNQSPTSSSTSTNGSRDRESEPLLSLKLSSAPSDEESMSRSSGFAGFNGNGDSVISVA